jgi:carnitine-CoA ligase
MKTAVLGFSAVRSLIKTLTEEYHRGTLGETIRLTRQSGRPTFARDLSHSDLLEEKARKNLDRPLLLFRGQSFSYRLMNLNANRVANYLLAQGASPGQGLAIMMKNSPRWLDIFFASQRLGMATVPVNVALRGNQLAHIFNHSEAKFLCIDQDLLPFYEKVQDQLASPPVIILNPEPGLEVPAGQVTLDGAYRPGVSETKPAVSPREGDPCLLLYTSGTTGLPKGVATRYGRTNLKMMGIVSRALLKPTDVYYTCLPLFHANALLLTLTNALHADAQVALSEKFSARRFWDEVRDTGATVFNGLGAMIPILMKQPEKPTDREHRVRYVLSAACPAEMWEPFEKRFGVTIVEGYGAVDSGGLIIMNWGQAPVGSLGRPIGAKCRVVDANLNDVPLGQPGELIAWVGNRTGSVEYFKNEKATSDKVQDGWLHTGDLVYVDKKGYLYFVGRKTESLRRRGENISCYEVEHAILQHPDVLECAVYAVPSDLAEDDVMAAIVPLEGKKIDANQMVAFLNERLARFAVPRYFRFLPELPKTETQRVIKGALEKEGVTPDTLDMEPGGKKQGA